MIVRHVNLYPALNRYVLLPIARRNTMQVTSHPMSLFNVPTFYQYRIRGGIPQLAVLFDQCRRSKRVH
jgi:ribose/xylose/arabinose/galactoside ABC-type transport system permease subunit